VAGWGAEVFWARNYWFWVPVVGPLVGGVLGAVVYHALIGHILPAEREEPGRVVEKTAPARSAAAGAAPEA
jgi:hypothetical protein